MNNLISPSNPMEHMFTHINASVRNNWNEPAFSDFQKDVHYSFGEVATRAARLGVLFDNLGVAPGSKIAICGTNCSDWAVSFLSILMNDRVVVGLLPDFVGEDIEKLVNHSDAELLFAGPAIIKKIRPEKMPRLCAIINIDDYTPAFVAGETEKTAFDNLDSTFAVKYPNGYSAADVHYREDNLDELALINYTSGTTSSPKGVMLTYRSLSSNVQYSMDNMECHPGLTLVSMLPLAHMFGMLVELLFQFAGGSHVCFITRLTTPTLIRAFKECHPLLIVAVPLVLEKIYQKQLKPVLNKPVIKALWNVPCIGTLIRKKVHDQLLAAFGGNLKCLIAGGAAMNPEVEKCMMDVRLPFLVGYGMTECGPLVGYVRWQDFRARSCGKLVDRMELRIDSADPENIPGEILLRGDNVMTGYYKNEEATRAAFTDDGWMRTGDMGVVDKDGFIYLRGRCKTLILSPNGQNIYPEEIEALLNAENVVEESLIVSRDGKLVALIYPGEEDIKAADLQERLTAAISNINPHLPKYSQIAAFEVQQEEFQKTPKKSIKRFLYS
ncbi:MAG: AMP-binding protein [Paludibacteraceae bacterium]